MDPNEYAAAMLRANALTGRNAEQDDAEIAAATAALKNAGLDGDLARVIDAGVVRWRLRVTTARGSIDILLDECSDWKSELEDAGIL